MLATWPSNIIWAFLPVNCRVGSTTQNTNSTYVFLFFSSDLLNQWPTMFIFQNFSHVGKIYNVMTSSLYKVIRFKHNAMFLWYGVTSLICYRVVMGLLGMKPAFAVFWCIADFSSQPLCSVCMRASECVCVWIACVCSKEAHWSLRNSVHCWQKDFCILLKFVKHRNLLLCYSSVPNSNNPKIGSTDLILLVF